MLPFNCSAPLRNTDSAGLGDLDYSGSDFWKAVLKFGTVAIIFGIYVLLTAIVSIIGLARRTIGKVFRVIYVLAAAIIVVMLILVAVGSFLVLRNRDSGTVRNFIEDAWERTVETNPKEVCDIEDRFDCRGFSDGNVCAECALGTETGCNKTTECARCNVDRSGSGGCWSEIRKNLKDAFLPVGIVSSVLAAIVLVDIFMTCAL